VVEEILGDRKVEGVRIKNVQNSNQKSEIKCHGVFVAIGHSPNTEIFRNQIELDNKGYIKKYEESKTSVEGVFVAGDVYDYEYRQAITAAGSGCNAAIDVIRYLEGKENEIAKVSTVFHNKLVQS
jgi:thioredoxin reductase (NADPH)